MRAIKLASSKGARYYINTYITTIIFILSSCGSSGISSLQNEQNGIKSQNIVISQADISKKKAEYNTREYQNNWGLDAIKAKEAYAILDLNNKEVAGKNVTVAVIDQLYADKNHNELNNNINSDEDEIKYSDHATHIAGIIAGNKNNEEMQGIAYDAKILSLATNYDDNLGFNKLINSDASIANLSWGIKEGDANALRNILENTIKKSDILLIAAAGNKGDDNPVYPARFAAESQFEGRLIAVASIDNNMKLSSFSNKCGVAKNNCLVAPGSEIYSSIRGDDYGYLSGTSMSAPHVSGAAAIIKGAWNHLDSTEIANILLDTTTKIDEQGNILDINQKDYANDIYGRGILNIENALKAQGELKITTADNINQDNQDYKLSETSLEIESSFIALNNLSNELADGIVLDKYGRDYKLDLNKKITQKKEVVLAKGLANNNIKQKQKFSYQKLNFTYLDNMAFNIRKLGFNYSKNNYKYKFSFSVNQEKENQLQEQESSLINFNQNTALSLASKNSKFNPSVSFANKLSKNITLKNYLNLYDIDRESKNHNLGLGFLYKKKNTNILLNYGLVSEAKNKALNNITSGALAIENDKMRHIDLAIKQKIKNIDFFVQGFFAKAKLKTAEKSLIENISNIYVRELKFGIEQNINKKSKIGILYKEPLSVTKGKIKLNYATEISDNGKIIRNNKLISLRAKNKIKNIELYYKTQLENGNLSLNLIYQNPLLETKIITDYGFMVKFSSFF